MIHQIWRVDVTTYKNINKRMDVVSTYNAFHCKLHGQIDCISLPLNAHPRGIVKLYKKGCSEYWVHIPSQCANATRQIHFAIPDMPEKYNNLLIVWNEGSQVHMLLWFDEAYL